MKEWSLAPKKDLKEYEDAVDSHKLFEIDDNEYTVMTEQNKFVEQKLQKAASMTILPVYLRWDEEFIPSKVIKGTRCFLFNFIVKLSLSLSTLFSVSKRERELTMTQIKGRRQGWHSLDLSRVELVKDPNLKIINTLPKKIIVHLGK